MFTLTGTGGGISDWFCLPATAADLVAGPAVEDILLARDEMANLAWAVESVIEGPAGEPVSRARELRIPPVLTAAGEDRSRLSWQLGSTVPPFWYPLVPDVQQP